MNVIRNNRMKTIFFNNSTYEREENNNTRERGYKVFFEAEETSASLTLSGKDLIWKE